ncbi:MAG: hypothetical protein CME88_02815 [Hirschia sp.]|nr:hypothetical protein [Hirschia sp.]MBF17294.1 hypothetical protein [Hirschia sp.]|tara:strand:+ start:131 stop:517 length:387 start_codon:yes stop_codon:yes gene_type:complete
MTTINEKELQIAAEKAEARLENKREAQSKASELKACAAEVDNLLSHVQSEFERYIRLNSELAEITKKADVQGADRNERERHRIVTGMLHMKAPLLSHLALLPAPPERYVRSLGAATDLYMPAELQEGA